VFYQEGRLRPLTGMALGKTQYSTYVSMAKTFPLDKTKYSTYVLMA
jgi:hypothetical protein